MTCCGPASCCGKGEQKEEKPYDTLRENWSGRFDFVLSCVGYAVGLGNIWRFPYLCYKGGGATFLIPYVTFLILCGYPLFFLEIAIGQFSNLSPVSVWKFSPLFKGIGYGMVIVSGIVCIYYNIIIAWTLYYLVRSFTATLPWADCSHSWNTETCAGAPYVMERVNASAANSSTFLEFNMTTSTLTYATLETTTPPSLASFTNVTGYIVNATNASLANATLAATTPAKLMSPSEQFWRYHVLQLTPGIEDLGEMRWELAAALLVAWIVVFLCLIRGIKSSGKVVYVTATFPYIVLIILLVRGVTLPGAAKGIKYYLIPQWHKLADFTVWGQAATQIFYSVGMGWGGIITMASYNKFHNNCYRDALFVPAINCGTSIFAGFVIFSVIGFMSEVTGSPIDEVVTQGPGLIFVVYPSAIAKLPISPLWAVLFFLMVFMIGLDSQFGMFETLTSAFVDEFPKQLGGKVKKLLITAFFCALELVIGLACVMQGGMYVLQMMDWYTSVFSIMILTFTECVVIAWVYGVNRFYRDIELMVGYRPCAWWKYCWCFITPAIIVFVFLFSLATHTPITYGDYQYPGWAVGVGWVLASISVIPLPIVAAVQIYRRDGPILQRVTSLMRPAPDFGPQSPEHKEEWLATLPDVPHPRFTWRDLPWANSESLQHRDDLTVDPEAGNTLLKQKNGDYSNGKEKNGDYSNGNGDYGNGTEKIDYGYDSTSRV